MSSRTLRSTRKERQQEVQIEDLAFTVAGWAAQVPDAIFSGAGDKPTKMTARVASSKAYMQRMKQASSDSTDALRPPLEHLPGAGAAAGPDAEVDGIDYLVVGFVYPLLEEAFKVSTTAKQMPIGIIRPGDAQIKAFDSDSLPPLIAVVRMMTAEQIRNQDEGTPFKTFVLLQDGQKRGLTPYTVAQAEVFYLARFRDNTTAKISRGPNWNRKIVDTMSRMDTSSADNHTAKQRKTRMCRDVTRVLLDPRHSYVNELLTLAAGLEQSSDLWFVDQLEELLRNLEPDLEYRPLPANENLYAFSDGEELLSGAQLEGVQKELLEMWPELDGEQITVGIIAQLDAAHKDGRGEEVDDGLWLDYRLLRGFIAEGARRLHTEKGLSEYEASMADFAKDVYASVKCITPLPESMPSIKVDGTNALLLSLRNLVKQLVDAARKFDTDLPGIVGDATMQEVPTKIWSKHAYNIDVDSAKAAFMATARFFSAELMHKERSLGKDLEEMLDILTHLKLD